MHSRFSNFLVCFLLSENVLPKKELRAFGLIALLFLISHENLAYSRDIIVERNMPFIDVLCFSVIEGIIPRLFLCHFLSTSFFNLLNDF